MATSTILVIGGTSYSNTGRMAGRIHIDQIRRDMRGYDELAFSVHGGPPDQAFPHGTAVTASVNFGLGGGSVLKFKGEITDCCWEPSGPHGWVQGYQCQGMKYQSDRVPITAPDLTGSYILNRTPEDPYYAATDAGLTLGQMFNRILTIQSTADALDAVGVNYASLSPPTLASATVADLALLDIVPPQPITFVGESILNTMAQHLARWMPIFDMDLLPDGTIRFKDTTDPAIFIPRTITLPGPGGPGDAGALWPRIRASTARCATRIVLRGGPITGVALLSTLLGTLKKTWSGTDETNWDLTYFTSPKNAKDSGTISSLSSNTATVTSSNALRTWASNYWPGVEGVIYLTNTVAAGLAMTEFRSITTNTSLSAAGTSIITWDASQALDNTGYNKYTLVARAGGLVDVGRLYDVCEPNSGAVGLATYIGAHLVTRSPIPIPWANNTKSIEIFYPTALIIGGSLNIETPMAVEAIPSTGQFRLAQPAVLPNGSISALNIDWPTTTAGGLPTDVQVLALYSRGINEAVVPADISSVPQYQGTAYTDQGLEVTKYIEVPAFVNQWDSAGMTALATQHLLSLQDTVYEGSGTMVGEPTWDVFDFNYALNYDIDGTTSPWSGINAPVRAVTMSFPHGAGFSHQVSFEFSTQRRPFAGDDLYLHPSFTGGSMLSGMQGLEGMDAYAGHSMGDLIGRSVAGTAGMSPGEVNIPTSLSDLGVPTSFDDLGIDPTGGLQEWKSNRVEKSGEQRAQARESGMDKVRRDAVVARGDFDNPANDNPAIKVDQSDRGGLLAAEGPEPAIRVDDDPALNAGGGQ